MARRHQVGVAAERIVRHAPGPGREAADGDAAIVLVGEGDVLLVVDARDVDLAVAPALAEQARDLEAPGEIEPDAEVGLKQREPCAIGFDLRPRYQRIGPGALPVLVGEQLAGSVVVGRVQVARATAADVGRAAVFHLGETGQAEGAELEGAAGVARHERHGEHPCAAQQSADPGLSFPRAAHNRLATANRFLHGRWFPAQNESAFKA